MAVDGARVYTVEEWYGLVCYDLNSPESPVELGHFDETFLDHKILLADSLIADVSPSITRFFDFSDPANPEIAGYASGFGSTYATVLRGSLLYSACVSRVGVVEFTDLQNVVQRSAVEALVYLQTISKHEDVLFASPDVASPVVVDLHGVPTPRVLSQVEHDYPFFYDTRSHYLCDSLLYAASGGWGLKIADINDLSNPEVLGVLDTPGTLEDLTVRGSYAYLASGDEGLHVVDVSDPGSPVLLNTVPLSGGASSVLHYDSLLFVASGSSWGVHFFDISDPADPVEIAIASAFLPTAMDYQDGYLYVAQDFFGLGIIDARDPSDPIRIFSGSFPNQEHAIDICVQGHFAYMIAEEEGLRVVDVFDPLQPVLSGWYDQFSNADYAVDLCAEADTIMLATLHSGIETVVFEAPSSPHHLSLQACGRDICLSWMDSFNTRWRVYHMDSPYADSASMVLLAETSERSFRDLDALLAERGFYVVRGVSGGRAMRNTLE